MQKNRQRYLTGSIGNRPTQDPGRKREIPCVRSVSGHRRRICKGEMHSGRLLCWLLCTLLIAGVKPAGAQQAVSLDSLARFWQSIYDTTAFPQLWNATQTLPRELLAKAQPDEVYNGIGNPYVTGPPWNEGVPKVNEAYVWSLAKSGDNLWFGTNANTLCAVLYGLGVAFGTGPEPYETASVVCEFDEGQYPLLNIDRRSPNIYSYDSAAGILTKKTPDDTLISRSYGLRAAGALDGVVLLGGPGIDGVKLFAYDTETGAYLGSHHYNEYDNIRSFITVENILYTSMKVVGGGSHILRWTGDATDPFQFEVVGELETEAVFFAYHEGRICVSSWPFLDINTLTIREACVYISPSVPAGGLSSAHKDGWSILWRASDYDPDPITALSYAGGAMASFDGYLYWGTMHVPFASVILHNYLYEPADMTSAFLGSYRPIHLFRGRNLGGGSPEIELLYGMEKLPKYTPTIPLFPKSGGKWVIVPNNMGMQPLWGPAGWGNFYNNYTWTMSVFENQLYVGTMDWSYLYIESMSILLDAFGIPEVEEEIELPPYHLGGDLFRIPDSDSEGIAESLDGVGNYSSYGIRTMVADDALYLGMANPMNLLTDTTDHLPEGGWELIRLGEASSGILDLEELPARYILTQNYPNPFNSETTIAFSLPTDASVSIDIYDTRGRRIRNLVSGRRMAGNHFVTWDGNDKNGRPSPSGLFFIVFHSGNHRLTEKMLLIR